MKESEEAGLVNCPANCTAAHTVEQIAYISSASVKNVQEMMKNGLPYVQYGRDKRSIRIRHDALDEFMTRGFNLVPLYDDEQKLLGNIRDLRGQPRGYVYFLEVGGFHKVGCTRKPKSRLTSYKSLPFDVTVYFVLAIQDMVSVEDYLIGILEPYRVKGREWFKLPEGTVRWLSVLTSDDLLSMAYGMQINRRCV
jgi:hypothetical protein